jgi:methyl farnesoate epoxidase/farnesoate epoxidase
MSNLSEVYGPVIGFFFGPLSLPVICVCGSKAVKEALTNEDLDGRINTSLTRSRTAGFGLGDQKLIN